VPVKQPVIAASALSLIYPQDGVEGYGRDAFLDDLVDACEQDIRRSLDRGAHRVQIDFTEGRLSIKLDPSGGVLRDFVALNNRVLERFSDESAPGSACTSVLAGTTPTGGSTCSWSTPTPSRTSPAGGKRATSRAAPFSTTREGR
jgi:hypothetical protein